MDPAGGMLGRSLAGFAQQGELIQKSVGWAGQSKASRAGPGMAARHICRVNRSTELKGGTSRSHGQAWDQHHSGREPGQGLEHL